MTHPPIKRAAASDQTALEALVADGRLRELGRYVPPLSLPRAFGVGRDEVAHSHVLAELLNPARHAGAAKILSSLLREVARRMELRTEGEESHENAEGLRKIANGPFERVAVRRESMLIDVVVEVSATSREAVIGIENKIDAGEQPEQIARYQAALERAYPGRMATVVFLTPTGRAPTTASTRPDVPAVALGYEWWVRAIMEAREAAPHGGRDRLALLEFEAHLREEILREGKAGPKRLVRDLWRDHGRALRLVMELRPGLGDVRDECVGLLRERFPDARFQFYPEKRSALREIKMNLRSWDEAGFPFTFMIRADDGERPYVRVLIWRDSYRKRAEGLSRWANSLNASLGPDAEPLVDEGFSRIRGWDWHKVLREEDYPSSAEIADDAFDEDTVREAVGTVAALVELLRPHVEPHLNPRTEANQH